MRQLLITAALAALTSVTNASTTKTATFEARHELKVIVPDGAKKVRVWFAIPQQVPQQKVEQFTAECAFPTRIERDTSGNRFLYVEVANPIVKEFTIVTNFRVTRSEVLSGVDVTRSRSLTEAERKRYANELAPNTYVIIDDRIKQIAREVVGNEKNPVIAARKIYDWVLNYADYWVKDPANKKASPVGSTDYCLTTKTGNCTDFHSLWTSIARASGIPTRIVYGSFFKKELDGKDIDQSYHCWPEFYAPGFGWVPHDVAVADIFFDDIKLTAENTTLVQRTTAAGYKGKDLAMVDYYFGNIDERRVTWSVGRDLTLSPKQEAGPVNALPKAYIEVDGQILKEGPMGWVRKLTFTEVKSN